jgi:hypothetical protein
MAYRVAGPGSYLYSAATTTVVVYADEACTVLADIQDLEGAPLAGSALVVDATSQLPRFLGPADGTATLWVRGSGGISVSLGAEVEARVEDAEAALAAHLTAPDAHGDRAWATDQFDAVGAASAAQVAAAADATGKVSSHAAAADPHGDRAWAAGQFDAMGAATAAQSAAAADAASKVAAHVSTPDAHGDRAWASGQFDPAGAASAAQSAAATDATSKVAAHASAADPHGDRADAAAKYVPTGDSRLTNARTPTSHAASHAFGGSDPVTVAQSQVTGLTAALATALTQTTADARYPVKSSLVLNVKDFGAQGDGTTDDSTAIQNAINAIPASGGALYFPRGAYVVNTTLVPKSFTRLFGDSWGRAKLISTTTDLFKMDVAQVDRFEMDHLALDVTGGHAFVGAQMVRCHFHHLDINVRSADKSVWSAPNVALMVECYYSEIQYRVYGATRTVPAWNLVSSGVDLVTECVWERVTCWNNDSDATQYQFLLSCTNANAANRNNTWRNVVFEQACGGAIKADSATGILIDGCYSWDTPALSIQNALFAITKNAGNALVPRNTVIRSSGRVGDGLAANVYDISLSSTALQTTLDNVQGSTTSPIRMNLGGAVGVWLNNVQASATIDGVTAANYAYLQRGAFTAQPISSADAFTALMLDTTGARGALRGQGQNASQRLLTGLVAGDANARVIDFLDGKRTYGDGTNAPDATWRRSGAGVLSTDQMLSALQGMQVGAVTPDLGGGVGVFGLKNATTAPTTSPTNGAILYAENGVLKVKQADGTVITISPVPRLDQVGAPTAAVALNSQKITGLANGSAASDAAAFGQIPVSGTTAATYAAGNDSRITGALQAASNLSDVANKVTALTNLGLPGKNCTSNETNSTVTQQASTQLVVPVVASGIYVVMGKLAIQTPSGVSFVHGWTAPAGSTMVWGDSSTLLNTIGSTDSWSGTGAMKWANIFGTLTVGGSSGNLTVTFASGTAANVATLGVGSHIALMRIG